MNTAGQDWYDFVSRRNWNRGGVNDARLLAHESIAKWNSDVSPYLISNEWISARIASFLGLPCPPSALVRAGRTGRRYFASLRFGRSGEAVPADTDPTTAFARHPRMCTGVLLFDILIANSDRHAGNLAVDSPEDPKRIWIIDHDRALCGAIRGEAKRRLRCLMNRLGITAGSVTGENRHCLLDVVNTSEFMREWITRINSIPKWFLEDACSTARAVGLGMRLAAEVCGFLEYRKTHVGNLIAENRNEFTRVADWPLFP